MLLLELKKTASLLAKITMTLNNIGIWISIMVK
jgi:hypothetical protein